MRGPHVPTVRVCCADPASLCEAPPFPEGPSPPWGQGLRSQPPPGASVYCCLCSRPMEPGRRCEAASGDALCLVCLVILAFFLTCEEAACSIQAQQTDKQEPRGGYSGAAPVVHVLASVFQAPLGLRSDFCSIRSAPRDK